MRPTFADYALAKRAARDAHTAELKARQKRSSRAEGWKLLRIFVFVAGTVFCLCRGICVCYDMYEAHEKVWRTKPLERERWWFEPWASFAQRQLRRS